MFEQAPNQFIRDWLAYTGGSESPEIFNLWSGISALSAVMGRRYIYREGRLTHWPNFYIIIIGPAAVRKSSAGQLAEKIIKRHVKGFRFGPTDTAGRKQGLLSSYVRGWGDQDEDEEAEDKKQSTQPAANDLISMLANAAASATTAAPTPDPAPASPSPFAAAAASGHHPATASTADEESLTNTKTNPRELYVFADEFTTLIGLNQIDMTNCLTHLYYPAENYTYTLSKSERRIPYPCLSILGCTTPVSLASHLPPAAIGQGLTSRCIFVFEGKPGAKVFPPPELDKALGNKIGKLFAKIHATPFDEFHAEQDLIKISRTDAAFKLMQDIYYHQVTDLGDSRFVHYEQRRQEHMCKLAMVLAVGDNREQITVDDVNLANEILLQTETHMTQALGDIGLDKSTMARQELTDYLTNSWPLGISMQSFERNARRNMSATEYQTFLSNIVNSKRASISTRRIEGVDIQVLIPAPPKDKRRKQKLKQREVADPSDLTQPELPNPTQSGSATVFSLAAVSQQRKKAQN